MIRCPPLANPHCIRTLGRMVLSAGSTLWRVARTEYGALAWDPRTTAPLRFSPLLDAAGKARPAMYLGDCWQVALAETIFRTRPSTLLPSRFQITGIQLAGRSLVQIELATELSLVSLGGAQSQHALGAGVALGLCGCPESDYPQTRAWSHALLAAHPDAAGLSWRSRQHDDGLCRLLLEERCAVGALIETASIALEHGPGLHLVADFARGLPGVVLDDELIARI